MENNLTFSMKKEHTLTKSILLGAFFALPLSFLFGAFSATLLVSGTMLLFRAFLGTPAFHPLLWGGEILALGAFSALFSVESAELFPSLIPFYWGAFFFLALSLSFFGRKFLFPILFLTLIMAISLGNVSPTLPVSLFMGALGGIYPLLNIKNV